MVEFLKLENNEVKKEFDKLLEILNLLNKINIILFIIFSICFAIVFLVKSLVMSIILIFILGLIVIFESLENKVWGQIRFLIIMQTINKKFKEVKKDEILEKEK